MTPYQRTCTRLAESFLAHVEDEYGARLFDADAYGPPLQLEIENVRTMIEEWADLQKEDANG